MEHSIFYSSELVKSFEALNLTNGLTRCVKNNIYRLVRPCFFAGYRGKMVDFARYSDHHRTSLAHFLNNGKWNDALLLQALKHNIIEKSINSPEKQDCLSCAL